MQRELALILPNILNNTNFFVLLYRKAFCGCQFWQPFLCLNNKK